MHSRFPYHIFMENAQLLYICTCVHNAIAAQIHTAAHNSIFYKYHIDMLGTQFHICANGRISQNSGVIGSILRYILQRCDVLRWTSIEPHFVKWAKRRDEWKGGPRWHHLVYSCSIAGIRIYCRIMYGTVVIKGQLFLLGRQRRRRKWNEKSNEYVWQMVYGFWMITCQLIIIAIMWRGPRPIPWKHVLSII